jgi:hypothetical protein
MPRQSREIYWAAILADSPRSGLTQDQFCATFVAATRLGATPLLGEATHDIAAGVVVRHAEPRVPIPADWRQLAVDWLEHEDIDCHEATARQMRRQK